MMQATHNGRPSLARYGAFVAFALLLAAPAIATDEGSGAPTDAVVPPGQEELMATMLGRGATLPDDCKFSSGVADGAVIRATYSCPSGQVVYELTHPDNASDNAIQTERFAATVETGAPPVELTDVLASLIRSQEDSFQWASLEDGGDVNKGE
jgi:hypothetical protein